MTDGAFDHNDDDVKALMDARGMQQAAAIRAANPLPNFDARKMREVARDADPTSIVDDPLVNFLDAMDASDAAYVRRTGRSQYYDRAGQPMTWRQWADSQDHGLTWDEARRVAKTTVNTRRGGKRRSYWVSTVWLGMDHAFIGPPMIFETMVFSDHDSRLDHAWWRYSTEADAEAGHRRVVELIRYHRWAELLNDE